MPQSTEIQQNMTRGMTLQTLTIITRIPVSSSQRQAAYFQLGLPMTLLAAGTRLHGLGWVLLLISRSTFTNTKLPMKSRRPCFCSVWIFFNLDFYFLQAFGFYFRDGSFLIWSSNKGILKQILILRPREIDPFIPLLNTDRNLQLPTPFKDPQY